MDGLKPSIIRFLFFSVVSVVVLLLLNEHDPNFDPSLLGVIKGFFVAVIGVYFLFLVFHFSVFKWHRNEKASTFVYVIFLIWAFIMIWRWGGFDFL